MYKSVYMILVLAMLISKIRPSVQVKYFYSLPGYSLCITSPEPSGINNSFHILNNESEKILPSASL